MFGKYRRRDVFITNTGSNVKPCVVIKIKGIRHRKDNFTVSRRKRQPRQSRQRRKR